jgi:hypothetical protein
MEGEVMKDISFSRYGDCVPALVKNIYAEFGLPKDIMYSKFIDNGFSVYKTDLKNRDHSVGGTPCYKVIPLLKKFGIDARPLLTNDMRVFPTNEEIIKKIDSALARGEKIAVKVMSKGSLKDPKDSGSGHVYLITGKLDYISWGEHVSLYITMARNGDTSYDSERVYSHPYIPEQDGSVSRPLKTDDRDSVESIEKDVILDDMGLTEAGSKKMHAYSPWLYSIKGIKRPLGDLQEDVYKHAHTSPVNLKSKKLLKESADPRTKFWRYERKNNDDSVDGDFHNAHLRHKAFGAYLDSLDPKVNARKRFEEYLTNRFSKDELSKMSMMESSYGHSALGFLQTDPNKDLKGEAAIYCNYYDFSGPFRPFYWAK